MAKKKADDIEDIGFEDMIDIQLDTPFKDPVVPREPVDGVNAPPSPDAPPTTPQPPPQSSPPPPPPSSDGGSGGSGSAGNGQGAQYFSDDDIRPDSPPPGGTQTFSDHEEPDNGSSDGDFGDVKDVPPNVKNKAIKKTAATIAGIYQDVMPILPKKIAVVSEQKINRLVMANEIDINMEVETVEGTKSVGSFIDDNNLQAEGALNITDEMKEEWQECLEDVLKEKQVALTPIQRLGVVTMMHIVSLYGAAGQIAMNMKASLDLFKEAHAARKTKEEPKSEPQPQPQPPAEPSNDDSIEVVETEEYE